MWESDLGSDDGPLHANAQQNEQDENLEYTEVLVRCSTSASRGIVNETDNRQGHYRNKSH